jgi:hypothetical protein
MISAKTVWNFLNKVKEGTCKSKAFKDTANNMGETTAYRIFKTFKYNQVRIRAMLVRIKDPPPMPHTKDPALQTITHLKSAFEDNCCPISQFQHHFQASFF